MYVCGFFSIPDPESQFYIEIYTYIFFGGVVVFFCNSDDYLFLTLCEFNVRANLIYFKIRKGFVSCEG